MNTATLAAVAPSLATLTKLATLGVQRRGSTLRCKMPRATVNPTVRHDLTKSLLEQGASVQICESDVIWNPHLGEDGVVVWDSRSTSRDRDYVTFVVDLS